MPGSSQKHSHIPQHCRHKGSGRGVVRLSGRDHYTGRWGSPEADAEYRRLVAEWLASHVSVVEARAGSPAGVSKVTPPTIGELILAFWGHVQNYYRHPDGTPTGEENNYRYAFIGPRGQEILKPWIKADPDAYLFSPREAVADLRRRLRESRISKARPSEHIRPRRKPKKEAGECYTYRSYGYAIRRACVRAGVKPWHPHQLRHTRGTEVRKAYSLEGAQVALGHSNAKITEVYAERDLKLAHRIAAETG